MLGRFWTEDLAAGPYKIGGIPLIRIYFLVLDDAFDCMYTILNRIYRETLKYLFS